MPRLRELEATFLRLNLHGSPGPGEPGYSFTEIGDARVPGVAGSAEADGIMFLCPLCFVANKGRMGTHMVICWFVGKVPDWIDPKPGRWTPVGSTIDDVTFVPSAGRSQSVALLGGGCKWHGFLKDGAAE